MAKNVLIIGAGGVAQVVAHKVAQNAKEFGALHIASRTVSKAEQIITGIREKGHTVEFTAHSLDAMDSKVVASLIRQIDAKIVINVGSAFVNMTVLQGCIDTGAAYLDTAIHEDPAKVCETPPWYGNYEWKRREACEKAGITAILGVGFDPGVVNAYARLAEDEYFDKVDSIDIVDINAGSHGRWFATNFDPEINFREFTGTVYSWQKGAWQENKMFEVGREWDLPVVGKQTAYLSGHDEVHSLSARYKDADVRFWMGFGAHYINVFTVLQNLGLLSEKPVTTAEGLEVVPLKLVKAVLPDPSSLAADYEGKTCIGDLVKGTQDGKPGEVFIYNVADHKDAFNEVGSQGISYTAGVPPVAAAILVARGIWDVKKMANVEDLPARPFLELLGDLGLPTRVIDATGDHPL
ncbi:saccharopine dehydrogenase family protein [Paracoccus shanxieyensis]|uniref:Saccharopine dehydrogenase n=1 Tax=Paracoccus shanxieyensis TaxID=2675752 RepID=A0A6L6J119_9RHOB|nr:saccharopine dehydrogenase family protein [Paracoccus shanxieyensis]MTH66273.1 saccharopine dehydrogenase [Paracoccus shanxieyensis]MTH89535.1 saccharopine dehydrogenase [Paracoccus shanxieyensis]